jgi:16S rRNA (guanine527-N7)-methyltransferase
VNDARKSLEAIVGPVSRETMAHLAAFQTRLERWTRTSNLVAPSTLSDFWRRHVLDSAQLLPFRRGATIWLDLGSGGGLPGLVVAILLRERPGAHVCLVESNAKKAAFLSATVVELGLPVDVYRCRIEAAHEAVGSVEVVTARALAPLPKLLRLASPWLLEGATGLFHKGRDFVGELSETNDEWLFDLIQHESAVDAGGRILQIDNLKPRLNVTQDQNGTSHG